jgi:hypothetical protein
MPFVGLLTPVLSIDRHLVIVVGGTKSYRDDIKLSSNSSLSKRISLLDGVPIYMLLFFAGFYLDCGAVQRGAVHPHHPGALRLCLPSRQSGICTFQVQSVVFAFLVDSQVSVPSE